MPASRSKRSQSYDSRASLDAIPIFDTNSRLLTAARVSSTFEPIPVPARNTWLLKSNSFRDPQPPGDADDPQHKRVAFVFDYVGLHLGFS